MPTVRFAGLPQGSLFSPRCHRHLNDTSNLTSLLPSSWLYSLHTALYQIRPFSRPCRLVPASRQEMTTMLPPRWATKFLHYTGSGDLFTGNPGDCGQNTIAEPFDLLGPGRFYI